MSTTGWKYRIGDIVLLAVDSTKALLPGTVVFSLEEEEPDLPLEDRMYDIEVEGHSGSYIWLEANLQPVNSSVIPALLAQS